MDSDGPAIDCAPSWSNGFGRRLAETERRDTESPSRRAPLRARRTTTHVVRVGAAEPPQHALHPPQLVAHHERLRRARLLAQRARARAQPRLAKQGGRGGPPPRRDMRRYATRRDTTRRGVARRDKTQHRRGEAPREGGGEWRSEGPRAIRRGRDPLRARGERESARRARGLIF